MGEHLHSGGGGGDMPSASPCDSLPQPLLHCQLMDGRECALRNVNSEGNFHFKEGIFVYRDLLDPCHFVVSIAKTWVI